VKALIKASSLWPSIALSESSPSFSIYSVLSQQSLHSLLDGLSAVFGPWIINRQSINPSSTSTQCQSADESNSHESNRNTGWHVQDIYLTTTV
jgi:hypothetical protein